MKKVIKVTIRRTDNPGNPVGNEGPKYRIDRISGGVTVELSPAGERHAYKTLRVGDVIDEVMANDLANDRGSAVELHTLAPAEAA